MAELVLISIRSLNSEPFGNSDDRRAEIMSFAGAWSDMSESDFGEFLTEAKRSGGEMVGRDYQLP